MRISDWSSDVCSSDLFPIDYLAGVLGAFSSFSNGLPPSVLGQPFFRNNTDDLKIKSYGLFGEAYFEVTDRLKLTAGLRYNNDRKSVRARSLRARSNGKDRKSVGRGKGVAEGVDRGG